MAQASPPMSIAEMRRYLERVDRHGREQGSALTSLTAFSRARDTGDFGRQNFFLANSTSFSFSQIRHQPFCAARPSRIVSP